MCLSFEKKSTTFDLWQKVELHNKSENQMLLAFVPELGMKVICD